MKERRRVRNAMPVRDIVVHAVPHIAWGAALHHVVKTNAAVHVGYS